MDRFKIGTLIGMFFFTLCFFNVPVMAKSGTITFSTESPNPVKGQDFTVLCEVESDEGFLDTEFYISYDARLLTFKEGGKKVSGGKGLLHVASKGNKEATLRKTFSLQFEAKKAGATIIEVNNVATIADEDGTGLSVSSNQLSLSIIKEEPDDEIIVNAGEPVKSNNNKLSELSIDALSMTPEFSKDVTKYKAVVANDVKTLFYHYVPEDMKSRVRVEGVAPLSDGENKVQFLVTSESGQARIYEIMVRRETKKETDERLLKEEKSLLKGVGSQASEKDGAVESNQFDRKEKTVQRYTGELEEKANRSAHTENKQSNQMVTILFVICVILVLAVIALLSVLLKLVDERKKRKKAESNKDKPDDWIVRR